MFGSVAKDEHKEGSDIDICVEMEPDLFMTVRLKKFLEKLVDYSVDLIYLYHNHIAHAYFDIDAEIIFKVITNHLDPLLDGPYSFFKN
ncbi:nucleotidyltransferase domain-containing protein [Parabacteroides distasonis]|uniref:nucleotidyltransferase domain-containing protein n=1 Tax=Parabacteroides distasonis TaxID=823 RepID=UPI0020C5D1E4|nr:nucleotidyltransferase domain-containing protein [Parabacteroides distasonis]WRY43064.1 nucleotidyltransferase domain-containing protein [Parabacteroides distasonis]